MTYQEAIAVRRRQINSQPVDRDELAQANRVIAHQRSMAVVFHNEYTPAPVQQAPSRPVPSPAPVRAALPLGCISVDEWLRTLPASESYRQRIRA